MKYSYIFIVTYGRSGSTLLQGIMNSLPMTIMRGENNNFLYGLYKSWAALKDEKLWLNNGDVNHPWYGFANFSARDFEKRIVSIVDEYLLGGENRLRTKCLGFKEIRYLDVPDLNDYLEFILSVFPSACLVFNTRNHEDVVKSGWWKDHDPDHLTDRIKRFESTASDFASRHSGNSIMVSYDELIKKDRMEAIRLLKYLGYPYHPERIEAVFTREHSYGSRTIPVKDGKLVEPEGS